MPASALDALRRERAALAPFRHATPLLWSLLDERITAAETSPEIRLQSSVEGDAITPSSSPRLPSTSPTEVDAGYATQLAALHLHAAAAFSPLPQGANNCNFDATGSQQQPSQQQQQQNLHAQFFGVGATSHGPSPSHHQQHHHLAASMPLSAPPQSTTPQEAMHALVAAARGMPHQQSQSQALRMQQTAGRKRVKLPVPAEKYPEYNFVGRLLGPRGTTLKTLERDTGCKIMIRGKGSIRKDKEADVRGKPGWEHVFAEPLHVVIEVADAVDDVNATRALIRAKEAVELLLVPVPEERDGLKRQQLRDLAILNGTFRGAAGGTGAPAPPQPPAQPALQRMCHSALPSTSVASSSLSPFGLSQATSPVTAASSSASATPLRTSSICPQASAHSSQSAPMQQAAYQAYGSPYVAAPLTTSQRPHHQHAYQHSSSSSSSSSHVLPATRRTLSSTSSSCTVASSPPSCATWGPPNGGGLFALDSLGHGFLGESAAAATGQPVSAPAPRVDFTSCSSADDDEEHDPVSSCATSLEGGEDSSTANPKTMSPESSAFGLVFMGADFYNGAFANPLGSADSSANPVPSSSLTCSTAGVASSAMSCGNIGDSTPSSTTGETARLTHPWGAKASTSPRIPSITRQVSFDTTPGKATEQRSEA